MYLLNIEFTAAHEEIALGVRAEKTALVIDHLGTAYRTVSPPAFVRLFWRWGFGRLVHLAAFKISQG
jgi:hypothetical protein